MCPSTAAWPPRVDRPAAALGAALLVPDEANQGRAAGWSREGALPAPGRSLLGRARSAGGLSSPGLAGARCGPMPLVDLGRPARRHAPPADRLVPAPPGAGHGSHVASAMPGRRSSSRARPTAGWPACRSSTWPAWPLWCVPAAGACRWRSCRTWTTTKVAARMAVGVALSRWCPHTSSRSWQPGPDDPCRWRYGHPLLGGARTPAPTLTRARAAGLPVLTTYGLTETSYGIAVGGAERATLADPAALRPLPGVHVRVADRDPADGVGQIQVQGPMVFEGYVGDAPAAPTASPTAGCAPGTSARWTLTGCCASPIAARTWSSRGARTSTPGGRGRPA